MNRLIAFFIQSNTLVNILTVAVFGAGIFALMNIKRESFPNIDFDSIRVLTTFPGAAPEAVEQLVTNPLEQALRELDGIKTLTSVSAEATSVIGIELDPDVTDSQTAQSEVQDIVDSWQNPPEDINTPKVTAIQTKLFPVITVSLSAAEGVSEETMKQTAQSLERSIESLRDVAGVQFEGLRDYEIQVTAQSALLRKWDVSLQEIISALRRSNVNIPGGIIWQDHSQDPLVIRTVGKLDTVADIENTVVRANTLGKPVYVKNVADVTRDFTTRQVILRTNGKPSYNLVVLKKERGDIIRLVEDLKNLMASERQLLPPGVSYDFIDDSSYFVTRRLNVLQNNLLVGLALVVLILSIALPFRMALISAFGIPFAFLAALALMYLIGVSINIISMLGLILVLGMLVDDAIVVTENAQRNVEKGLSSLQAALQSSSEIWPPLLTSVSTTMMAFLPLMFLGGTLGKFIQYIPYGVLLGLVASLAECFFILPNHIAHWSKAPRKNRLNKPSWWKKHILPLYGKIIGALISFRYGVLVALVVFFGVTLNFFAQNMRFVMFPAGTIDSFTLRVEGDVGAELEDTAEAIEQIEAAVARLPATELKDFTSISGRTSQGRRRSVSGYQYGQVKVNLTESNARERSADEIITELKQQIGELPQGFSYRVSKSRAGPPRGKPVEIGVRGESYEDILQAVVEIKELLSQQPGVTDISDSYRPGKTEVHIEVNPYQAAAAGLSMSDVGQGVRASYEGIVATSVRTLSEEIDIRVYLAAQERRSLQALKALKITNARGQRIPLATVARFVEKPSIAAYEHEGGERQVKVEAEIRQKETSSLKVNAAIKQQIAPLKERLPQLSFVFAGEERDTKEDLSRLLKTLSITLAGILLLLILLFGNLIQPLAVALTIPMGVIPIIWTFYFHGMNLSFLALVGMVALAGVIVNNAIVLTDFANRRRADHADFRSSLTAAAGMRLRPILLTTITTVCGILPTAYGIGGLDPFVKPLALALGWGLAVGSLLVCFCYPPVLAIAHDFMRLFSWIWHLPRSLLRS